MESYPLKLLSYAFLFLAIDSIWLSYIGPTAHNMILKIQGSPLSIRIIPAILIYFILAYLVTVPKDLAGAFMLGFSTYAIYDLTNYAMLKKYSLSFAIGDMIWGGVLMGSVWYIKNAWRI